MKHNPRIVAALEAATDTKAFVTGYDILPQAPAIFKAHFNAPARIVADPNTYAAAGEALAAHCRAAALECAPPIILRESEPYADAETLETVRAALAQSESVAIAVGAGTINDICKRASELLDRPYMVVATAASMDGYASFGAPITTAGFKKTEPCRAPVAILADTITLADAPLEMTAAGYADLAAKITGGSDWLLADASGDDPIRPDVWEMTQVPLRSWLAHPERLAKRDPERLEALFEGLTLCGFGMQATQTSRPASGAEHLFSHVWEMTGVTDPRGREPSHGFKVGLGTLATTALTEAFFSAPFTEADIDDAVNGYPDWEAREAFIKELFGDGPLLDSILAASYGKHLSRESLRDRLHAVARQWPKLKQRAGNQLLPFTTLREMLSAAGCPVHPAHLGLSPARVSATVFAAQMIRNRYTILDLAAECGRLPLLASQLGHVWGLP